jgi:hypothetical protein
MNNLEHMLEIKCPKARTKCSESLNPSYYWVEIDPDKQLRCCSIDDKTKQHEKNETQMTFTMKDGKIIKGHKTYECFMDCIDKFGQWPPPK